MVVVNAPHFYHRKQEEGLVIISDVEKYFKKGVTVRAPQDE